MLLPYSIFIQPWWNRRILANNTNKVGVRVDGAMAATGRTSSPDAPPGSREGPLGIRLQYLSDGSLFSHWKRERLQDVVPGAGNADRYITGPFTLTAKMALVAWITGLTNVRSRTFAELLRWKKTLRGLQETKLDSHQLMPELNILCWFISGATGRYDSRRWEHVDSVQRDQFHLSINRITTTAHNHLVHWWSTSAVVDRIGKFPSETFVCINF